MFLASEVENYCWWLPAVRWWRVECLASLAMRDTSPPFTVLLSLTKKRTNENYTGWARLRALRHMPPLFGWLKTRQLENKCRTSALFCIMTRILSWVAVRGCPRPRGEGNTASSGFSSVKLVTPPSTHKAEQMEENSCSHLQYLQELMALSLFLLLRCLSVFIPWRLMMLPRLISEVCATNLCGAVIYIAGGRSAKTMRW